MARTPQTARRWTPPAARIDGDRLLKAKAAQERVRTAALQAKAEAHSVEIQAEKSLTQKVEELDDNIDRLMEALPKMIPASGGGRRTMTRLLNSTFISDNDDMSVDGSKIPLRNNVETWVNAKIVDNDDLSVSGDKIPLRNNVRDWVLGQIGVTLQARDADLDTLSTNGLGTAGLEILGMSLVGDVRDYLGVPDQPIFTSYVEMAADTPAADPDTVLIIYRSSATQILGSGGLYVKTGSEPSHLGKIQNGNGTWYELKTSDAWVEQFGAVGDNSTDCTAAYNSAIAYAVGRGDTLSFGPGVFRFNSHPDAITEKLKIIGRGYSDTVLRRNYASGGGNTSGLLRSTYTGGFEVHNVTVEANVAHSGGACAISAVATAGNGLASKIVLENVWITTQVTDGWSYPIYIDGQAQTTAASGGAIGARDNFFKNVHVFGCSDHAVTLYSVVGLTWIGGGLYTAGGTSTSSLRILGQADPRSYYADIFLNVINGDVTFTHAYYCTVRATTIAGGVINASNCLGCKVESSVISGTKQYNWIDSAYQILGVTTYTPTLTASAGTITTVGNARGWWRQSGSIIIGGIDITITTNGTGSGTLIATLPRTVASAASSAYAASGQEVVGTGKSISGYIADGATTITSIRFADGTYPGANGYRIVLSFAYEIA